MRAVVVDPQYLVGEWSTALSGAEAFIAEVETGLPHYLASATYFTRGLIRLARGEADAALVDGEEALRLAERAADPQQVLPTRAVVAHIYSELGDKERAASLADESLSHLKELGPVGFAGSSMHVFSWTLTALGRGPELEAALTESTIPWTQAALAFAAGDPLAAADICAEIGVVTEEAYARLAAARMLLAEGRRTEGDEQLQRALAFYRSVGATRYVRQGESLLAASA